MDRIFSPVSKNFSKSNFYKTNSNSGIFSDIGKEKKPFRTHFWPQEPSSNNRQSWPNIDQCYIRLFQMKTLPMC